MKEEKCLWAFFFFFSHVILHLDEIKVFFSLTSSVDS